MFYTPPSAKLRPPTLPVVNSPKQHFLPNSPNHSALNYWFPVWRGCTWTTQLMSAGWQTVFSIGLNRCPLHLLPDNRHSVGWSSAGCRLISDISLSHSECLRFTFPKSALSVIIGDKSILPGQNHLTWLLWGKKKRTFRCVFLSLHFLK